MMTFLMRILMFYDSFILEITHRQAYYQFCNLASIENALRVCKTHASYRKTLISKVSLV